MRDYLKQFLESYPYTSEDCAVYLDTYDRMASDAHAYTVFCDAMDIYEKDISCDYACIIQAADDIAALIGVNEYTVELLMFMCLSKHTKRMYQLRGIDEEIFRDSMLDLWCKNEECKAVKGIVGTFVAGWFYGFFNLTRFGIGRLQFEEVRFEHRYEKDGYVLEPDDRVINVHIPRTLTPLDEESCRKAYACAKTFFKGDAQEKCVFVCHSWLLYPEHKTLLSPQSNIYRFMQDYDIIEWGIDKNRCDMWRLFDTDEMHPDRLPTDTALRRRYVEHLKSGGKLGWGFGVYVM